MKLVIDAIPPIVLAIDADAVGEHAAALGAEMPNVTVTLDNGTGLLTGLFALPPLRAGARVEDGDAVLVAGTVQSVRCAAELSVVIQS